MKDIISKDDNIDKLIYNILNGAYHEFTETYGEKHAEHIKKMIEDITDKVIKEEINFTGAIAMANAEKGIVYSEAEDLPGVLKHEMWHVYNNSAQDREKSLQYIPKKYINQMEENGYIKNIYNEKMDRYKKDWKDEPERLELLLVSYEKFKNEKFDFEDSPVEMWTEWFNSQTHTKDTKDNFWDWKDGFYTKTKSTGSSYDSYLNIASMISCIIPKEKLLDMYLNTEEYNTEYSYPEMLEEFDETYNNALDEGEKKKYKYPYLKIILDVKTISENAKDNPLLAREKLQNCMKTCFNSYLIKLENTQNIDYNKARQIYYEIKNMQEHMLWNTDISKMKDLEYVKSMEKIQDKFKGIIRSLNLESTELENMSETINYDKDNPYKLIEDGQEIEENITKNDEKNTLKSVGEYKTIVEKKGIKSNLYGSLAILLGDKKYNLLFEKFQGDSENNILLNFHNLIKNAKTDNDVKDIYDKIYELYINKLETDLDINGNIGYLFDRYSSEIANLQSLGLFNDQNKSYSLKLEEIIDLFSKKTKEYEKRIDDVTENNIQDNIKRGQTPDDAKIFAEMISNRYKERLHKSENEVIQQRKLNEKQISIYRMANKQTIIHNQETQIAELKRIRNKE